ncbi:trypsin-like peptidase domain-containing protein [Streptomyces sp. CdTB01]|uniref:trypsin-like peptidase domain-containing protein n=1 Tax=Streptomyces sp. CdTB01 TaxID=1725411 RepID=UPI000AFF6A22
MAETLSGPDRSGEEQAALDSYSRTVTSVAAELTAKVAALNVAHRRAGGRFVVGTGSAVVFTDDGFLLTNAHVVGHADAGTASFADGTTTPFHVIGADPLSDLAVVRADGPTPPPARLGEADALRVGQLVVAVGNPLGLTGSVTAGVVSALGRSLPAGTGRATRVIDDVVQTDATLHPGSSGGALATADGRVVGINTAIADVGLGLAIPVNGTSRKIIAALLATGRVRRAYLGIAGTPSPRSPRAGSAAPTSASPARRARCPHRCAPAPAGAPACGSPRSSPPPRPPGPACAPATCCSPRATRPSPAPRRCNA